MSGKRKFKITQKQSNLKNFDWKLKVLMQVLMQNSILKLVLASAHRNLHSELDFDLEPRQNLLFEKTMGTEIQCKIETQETI